MSGLNSDTKLLLQAESPINGTVLDNSKEIIDASGSRIITQVGTAQLSTAQKEFGSTSLLLDGNSDTIYTDSAGLSILDSTSTNFVMDFRLRVVSISNSCVLFRVDEDADNHVILYLSYSAGTTNLRWQHKIGGGSAYYLQADVSSTLVDGNWHHVSVCKTGTDFGLYVDGTQIAYLSDSNTKASFTSNWYIGSTSGTSGFLNGYIDEFRIQKSDSFSATPNVGLTDTITVPTGVYTVDANTLLLLHMETQDRSVLGGNTPHIPKFLGTTVIDTDIKKWGSGSYLFDGNSDYIQIPDSTDFDIVANTTDSYTIDFWEYSTDTGTTQHAIFQGPDQDHNWDIYCTSGTNVHTWKMICYSAGYIINLTGTTATTPDNQFNHVAIVKVADQWGLYVNGTQVAYYEQTRTLTFASDLYIGIRPDGTPQYWEGNLDEIRIQKSNYFSASPNVGLTDTITVPTEAYSIESSPTTYKKSQTIIII